MTMKTKVRRIGNSLGIVLPKEAIRALQVREGEALYLTRAPGGGLRVAPDGDRHAAMMAIAQRGMEQYRHALRELAK